MNREKIHCRGFSLILTFLVIFLLTIIVVSIVLQLTSYSHYSLGKFYSACAFNCARSGIARARSELLNNPAWGQAEPVKIKDDYGACEVKVIADTSKTCWKIISQGKRGACTRTLTAWIRLESSLDYLWWSDRETSPLSVDAWIIENERFGGSCHTNGYFSIAGKPQFSALLTSSNLADPFYDKSTGVYTQGGETGSDNRLFYHYCASYSDDVPVSSSGTTRSCLDGAAATVPFPLFDKSWSQQATFHFSHNTVLVFFANGKIRVNQNGAEHEIPSDSIIYVDGVVHLRGTVKGKPIVVAEKDVIIKSPITYTDKTADFLSVISGEDIILDPPNALFNITVNGCYAALGGTFRIKGYDSGKPRGTLSLYGGILQKYSSPCCTFSSDYTVNTGFLRDFSYDARCKTLPSWFPRAATMKTDAFRDDSASSL